MEMRSFQMGENALYDLENACLIVHLPAEVDDHVSCRIRKEMEQLLQHRKARRLVFDFTNVQFMDSAGIGLLLNSYRWMRERGGVVSVLGANRRMNRMLQISGVYQIMECIS